MFIIEKKIKIHISEKQKKKKLLQFYHPNITTLNL